MNKVCQGRLTDVIVLCVRIMFAEENFSCLEKYSMADYRSVLIWGMAQHMQPFGRDG